MSETPETDALYAQMLAENPGNFIHLEEFLELARKLEQERDEALMDRASGDIATMTRNHYERLIKERDEARATIEDAKRALNATDYEGVLLAALRVKAERDEARDILRLYRQQIVMESSWSATDNFAERMEAAK